MNNSNHIKLGVLGSGKGSNFVAIADAIQQQNLPVTIAVVLSDVEDAGILARAKERGIPCHFVPPGKYRTKLDEVSEQAFIGHLTGAAVDYVVLAGFMRILKGDFLRAFTHKVLNIHPSLLPSFPGLEAWKQALEYGVGVTGCTVHLVDSGVDTGPILAQATVQVRPDDSAASLHHRIQEAEHWLYPEVVGRLGRDELQVQGRRVTWKPRAL